jgi:hypothetical protein
MSYSWQADTGERKSQVPIAIMSRQYFSCQVQKFPFICCHNFAVYNLGSCVERVELESLIINHSLIIIKVFQTKFITVSNRVGHNRAGTTVTRACSSTVSNLLCGPLFKHSAAPHFEQISVPFSKTTWFQEMMA